MKPRTFRSGRPWDGWDPQDAPDEPEGEVREDEPEHDYESGEFHPEQLL